MMMITSKDNATVKQLHKWVADPRARRKDGVLVAEGLRLCEDALQSGARPILAAVTPAFAAANAAVTAALAAASDAAVTVSDDVMRRLTDTATPQGVVCVCRRPAYGDLPSSAGRFVVLEGVADPANVGAVARTAEALGLTGLLLCGGCEAYSPKALRASMGALLRLPVYEAPVEQALARLHSLSVTTYAAVVRGAERSLTDCRFSPASAVVIGNEANGLTAATAAACTLRASIPMAGRAESLNAAAAAALFMWEMVRSEVKA